MAIQETIKTGRKYRKCIDNTPGSKKWERYSFWTKSTDVEFSDGTTAESKLGNYKGVTTNENQVAGYAADVTLVKTIKTSLSNLITSLTNLVNSINDRLGGMRFYEDSTGKYVVGADSVPKKLGSAELDIITVGSASSSTSFDIKTLYADYSNLTSSNFAFVSVSASKSGGQGQNDTISAQLGLSYNPSNGILTVTRSEQNTGAYTLRFGNLAIRLYAPKL